MLTPEQVTQIKEQLFKQIENWPEEQRQAAKDQIEEMTAEELEEFLIKNNMIKRVANNGDKESNAHSENSQECIFCQIINKKIPSYILAENNKSMAVLEINPISKGHTIILPKEHLPENKIPMPAFALAKKIASKIEKKLKPKKVNITTGEIFGHAIINVLPVYENEHMGSPRKKENEEELKDLFRKISIEKKENKPEKKKKQEELEKSKEVKLEKAPIRIP